MSSPHEAFREEAYELLTSLESSLLELEESPADLEIVGAVFRAMHTIKGSGAMFGFDDISSFTHDVETVYDLVRNGELAVTGELVNLSLAAAIRSRRCSTPPAAAIPVISRAPKSCAPLFAP